MNAIGARVKPAAIVEKYNWNELQKEIVRPGAPIRDDYRHLVAYQQRGAAGDEDQ